MFEPDGVHTIPVPQGWTPEQAWEAIRRADPFPTDNLNWAKLVTEWKCPRCGALTDLDHRDEFGHWGCDV